MANQGPYNGRPRLRPIEGRVNLSLSWPRNPRTGECSPHTMQGEVLACPSKHIGVVGGSGSGKSILGAMGFLAAALQLPNALGLVVGKDYNQVMGVQYKKILQVLKWWATANGGVDLISHASEYQKRIVLINGFTILFRTATDIERIQGLEVQVVWCDEFAIWSQQRAAWNEIHARMRPSADGQFLKSYWTSTPKGYFGISAKFKDKARNLLRPRVWVSDHEPEKHATHGYALFQMSTADNTAFEPEYAENLLGNYSKDEARQELEGEIMAIAGSVFAGVYDPVYNIIPFDFNPSIHPINVCIDHGSNYPYAAIVAEFIDDQGEPADIVLSEFTKNGVTGVQEIIWWIDRELQRLKVSKVKGIYPDPDKQYRRENLLLQTHYKCPVYSYQEKDFRSISWGTGLVKARLCDARNQRHYFIAKQLSTQDQNTAINGRGICRGLLTQEWAESRQSKNSWEDLVDTWKDLPGTHACDAHRYLISHKYKYLSADGSYRKAGGMTIYG